MASKKAPENIVTLSGHPNVQFRIGRVMKRGLVLRPISKRWTKAVPLQQSPHLLNPLDGIPKYLRKHVEEYGRRHHLSPARVVRRALEALLLEGRLLELNKEITDAILESSNKRLSVAELLQLRHRVGTSTEDEYGLSTSDIHSKV